MAIGPANLTPQLASRFSQNSASPQKQHEVALHGGAWHQALFAITEVTLQANASRIGFKKGRLTCGM